jgi:hypothetical protein
MSKFVNPKKTRAALTVEIQFSLITISNDIIQCISY